MVGKDSGVVTCDQRHAHREPMLPVISPRFGDGVLEAVEILCAADDCRWEVASIPLDPLGRHPVRPLRMDGYYRRQRDGTWTMAHMGQRMRAFRSFIAWKHVKDLMQTNVQGHETGTRPITARCIVCGQVNVFQPHQIGVLLLEPRMHAEPTAVNSEDGASGGCR